MNVVFAPSGIPASARNRAIGTFPHRADEGRDRDQQANEEQQHVTDVRNRAYGVQRA